MRSARRTRGFTLLELMVVVVLIGMITAVLVGAMSGGMQGQALRGAAREIAAQLRYTRTQALVSGRPQTFALNVDERTWAAPGDKHGVLPAKLQIDATTARDPDRATIRGRQNVARIRFFPDGSSTGGRVRLRPAGSAPDDAELRIDVAWLTGQVRIARGGGEGPR